jgi:hypothetical protein
MAHNFPPSEETTFFDIYDFSSEFLSFSDDVFTNEFSFGPCFGVFDSSSPTSSVGSSDDVSCSYSVESHVQLQNRCRQRKIRRMKEECSYFLLVPEVPLSRNSARSQKDRPCAQDSQSPYPSTHGEGTHEEQDEVLTSSGIPLPQHEQRPLWDDFYLHSQIGDDH